MTKPVNRFTTYILLLCCLALSLPPNTVLATAVSDDEVAMLNEAVVPTVPAEVVIESLPNNLASTSTNAPAEKNLEPVSTHIQTSVAQADNQPPPATNLYPGLVITQVQTTGGTNRSSEDFIELRNNSRHDIDITDWLIVYTTAAASRPSPVVHLKPTEATVGWRLILPASATYTIGTQQLLNAHPGLAVDQLTTISLASSGGRLLIADIDGTIHGGFAWGRQGQAASSPPAVPVDGEPFIPAENNMERKLGADGWHQNTRQNLADFYKSSLRDSYVAGQAEEVFDNCLNLDDIQLAVPPGWYRDEQTGNCSDKPPVEPNRCEGLQISEIGANLAQQFIEIQNATNQPIDLKGCKLSTNRNTKKYVFAAEILAANNHKAIDIKHTDLTLTKTTSGTVYLLSEDELSEVDSVSYANLATETSWAMIDGTWRQTYAITPGKTNVYQQYLPCSLGYSRNEETGRCNKVVLASGFKACASNQYRHPKTNRCRLISSASSTLKPCRTGQYRNPETNRCRNLASSTSNLKPCRTGQVRNPETNRCRSVVTTASSLKPCQAGWERNPETNRCRKIRSAATLGVADFAVEPIVEAGKGFAAWWALGGLTLLGAGYGAWEWRRELAASLRRIGGMISK